MTNSFSGYGGFVWGAFGLCFGLLLGYFWHSWQGYRDALNQAQQSQALRQAFNKETLNEPH